MIFDIKVVHIYPSTKCKQVTQKFLMEFSKYKIVLTMPFPLTEKNKKITK